MFFLFIVYAPYIILDFSRPDTYNYLGYTYIFDSKSHWAAFTWLKGNWQRSEERDLMAFFSKLRYLKKINPSVYELLKSESNNLY